MRVLITGHRGYIGAVAATVLRNARFEVVGLDSDLYGACDFGRTRDEVEGFDLDLREIEFTDLLSFDAVIHLAGLSEDEGRVDAALVDEINLQATLRLAECCKQAEVSRFIFASTCAVYGRSHNELLDERSPAGPITEYGHSKLECERLLMEMADERFCPTIVRHGLVYGVSPRLRLDTVVNEFTAAAVANGRIDLQTEGRAWRPLIHVEDAARVYAALLLAPGDAVRNQVFNAVSENLRVIEIADLVSDLVPGTMRYPRNGAFDPRSYRVSGEKFAKAFPSFKFHWTAEQGIKQIRDAVSMAGLTPSDWRSDRYRRIARLQSRLERGELDSRLRQRQTQLSA